MGNKPRNLVLSGLIKRRRDIKAKADYIAKQLVTLQEDVSALDKAICVIDPDFDLASIKPKRYIDPDRVLVPYQSEVTQLISDKNNPLTVAEICNKLIATGHPCESSADRKLMRDKIKNYLRRKVRRGWVIRENGRYRLCDTMIEARKPPAR